MKYQLFVKDEFGNNKCVEVPAEVYRYVLQLENYIRNPESSGLMNLYPGRFKRHEIDLENTHEIDLENIHEIDLENIHSFYCYNCNIGFSDEGFESICPICDKKIVSRERRNHDQKTLQ